ncbi:VTT domain-containing protein [uncultured Endozoicomonas sp.]|uniref:VTT domain-containing protein n=1 Tax=uncultured Endozoicomonas sp. TaxID=432652 RepID=UPI00261D06BF|nr:VTT domain-containing protein [uncultured Endozoicomonas sp.]
MDHSYLDTLHLWLQSNIIWVGPVIALVACLESLAVVGIVLPGVAMLFALGAIAGAAELSIFPILAWAFAGAVIGDGLSFLLGYHFHENLRRIWPFKSHPQWIERGELFFERYGVMSVVIGRFVGPIRPIIPAVAGMMNMRPVYFFPVNFLSAIGWAPVYLLPGYFTGAALQMHDQIPDQLIKIFVTVIAVSVLLPVIAHYLGKWLRLSLSFYLILSLVLCTFIISSNVAGYFDLLNRLFFVWLAPLYQPWVVKTMEWVTLMGSIPFLAALIIGTWLWQYRFERTVQVVPVIAGSVLMAVSVWGIKYLVDSSRPVMAMGLDPYSFPSGHTTATTFVVTWIVGTLAIHKPMKWQWIISSLGLFIMFMEGLSRLFLHVHWVGDVIAGVLIGLFWALTTILWQKMKENA